MYDLVQKIEQNKMPKWADRVEFLDFTFDDGNFKFDYSIDGKNLSINLSHSHPITLDKRSIMEIGFNIGMCYLLDICEIVLPKTICIYKQMSSSALSYWKDLYSSQIIEKCYVLQLPLSHRKVDWKFGKNALKDQQELISFDSCRDKIAVCLTGGKESLSILKTLENKKPLVLFFLDLETNTHRQKAYNALKNRHMCIKTVSDRKEVLRPLEKKYLGLQCGVDMAHLVFNTMLFGDFCRDVLIGNEYSANFPNDIYQGKPVNHQFVKTIEFAEKLNDYIHTFISKDFSYHSPFFGLYEYRIADLLFSSNKYLDIWTSCNKTTPETNFCSNCYKCAFTYLISRTKKSEKYLSKFFSCNMLKNVEIFRPLVDILGVKPLDCVGDKAEVWIAMEDLLNKKVEESVLDYYLLHVRPFILNDIAGYKKRVTEEQPTSSRCPADIHKIFKAQFANTDKKNNKSRLEIVLS